MSTSSPRISIILPCYNEGARIASSLATLDAWFDGCAEVLVIDDGSADDTFVNAQAYAGSHANVHLHRLGRHSGKGTAIRTAIPFARGESIVLMDADLAYDHDSVVRVLDGLTAADMVVGNRRHRDSRYSVPYIFSASCTSPPRQNRSTCSSALLGIGLRDTQSG